MKYILFFLFISFGLQAQRHTTGTVLRVVDGDTYIIKASYRNHLDTFRVRLVNVDCPEIYFVPKKRPAQPFGDEAKLFVAKHIEGQSVEITYYGKDQYGRIIAFIKIDGERLDDIILQNGYGWAYKGYTPLKDYKHGYSLMLKAQAFKLGLWALPDPIPPSKWRSQ